MDQSMVETPSRRFRSLEEAPIVQQIGNTPLLRIRLFEKELPDENSLPLKKLYLPPKTYSAVHASLTSSAKPIMRLALPLRWRRRR